VALPPLLADPTIDLVLVVLVPHLLLDATETAARICRVAQAANKPIITCFVGSGSVAEARRLLHRHHIPMFTLPETASRAVKAMCSYACWRSRPPQEARPTPDIDLARVRQLLQVVPPSGTLGEAETRPLLQACHIPVAPGAVALSETEAVTLASRLHYPVVLKLASPALLHKTEAGGVRLNLPDAPAVQAAYRSLRQANGHGVLVEKMISGGAEIIIGMRRDPQFGPLLMFGLGGIYVELLTDVAFRVAPVSHGEALEMIQQTKAGRLLLGARGASPADIDAVARCVVTLGQLALAFPQIESIEINPLHVSPDGVLALDGRVVLTK
jgi:acetyltransferase